MKVSKMTKNIRRLSQNQMEEILKKVSENLTVQFPNFTRKEYIQALKDLQNYEKKLTVFPNNNQKKAIIEHDQAPIIDFNNII